MDTLDAARSVDFRIPVRVRICCCILDKSALFRIFL
jgi:hypothetical protein